MDRKNKTHEFAVTYCDRIGRPCPAASRMLEALTKGLNQAKSVTEKEFEVSGVSKLNACQDGCATRFVARHDRIRLFCGVDASANQTELDQIADALFSVRVTPLPPSPNSAKPCALAEAHAIETTVSAKTSADKAQPKYAA